VDRDAIERSDFPVGRRGYDPAAVDAHLRQVADELEALRAQAAAPRAPLAAGASEQVRLILEAAETSAAELQAGADRRAGEHVARVREAAAATLARLDELESELDAVRDALRRSAARLDGDLARLNAEIAAPADPGEPPMVEEDFAAAAPAPAAATAEAPPAAPNGDEAGARLIALNLALQGTPREETARYLAERCALADPEALLDDVYARAGQ
jgi:DivIVA domain-containing protein